MKQLYNGIAQDNTFEVWDFVLKKDWILIHDDYGISAVYISKIENDWNISLAYIVEGRKSYYTWESQWILCSDRLPKKAWMYNVVTEWISNSLFYSDNWFWWLDGITEYHPTHWQPLPLPPN